MIKSNLLTPFPILEDLRSGLPNFCGWEAEIQALVNHNNPIFLSQTNLKLDEIKASFACALHFHQPTIPGGINGELISNLQYMFEHSQEGD
ncbi:MAG: glycosyl hydrolase family 57, partial [Planktothrix sp.]